ncbi:MAG TPA: hypothetical protein PKI61_00620 [bacterium]|nr:hypothetical protein [bacterium]HPT29391.1 hypothetical protein [bacterium]
MFSYRQILKQALRISWKNKFLWFFGLFASLLSIGAEYQILSRPSSSQAAMTWFGSLYNFINSGLFSTKVFSNIGYLFKTQPGATTIFLFIFIAFLVLVVFLIWLAVTSQVALVKNSEKIINDPKEKLEPAARWHLRFAHKQFWPVFGYNLISKVLVNVAITLVSLPLLFPLVNRFAVNTIYLILFIIFIPVAICISWVIKYAIAFLVLKNEKFSVALVQGWRLFRKNWLITVESGLLLFAVNFLATFAVLLACLVVAIPFIILAAAFLYLFSVSAFWVMVILGFLTLTVFVVICGSLLTTFQTVAWTDIFMKLNSGLGKSKMERLAPDSLKTRLG